MSKKENPPPPPEDDTERTEKMRLYRQRYWQRFHQTRKRVYGTLTQDEYAELERRAKDAGRAVWTQIHAEAEAYARGEYLPPKEIEERITELIVQLRRIGTNVNQITREFNTDGSFDEPNLLCSLDELESVVRAFVKRPWVTPDDNDGEP